MIRYAVSFVRKQALELAADKVTVNVPVPTNVCVGANAVVVVPSPKFHTYDKALLEVFVKFTTSGEQPLVLGPAETMAVTGPMLNAIFKAASLQLALESTGLHTPEVVGNRAGQAPRAGGIPPQLAQIPW